MLGYLILAAFALAIAGLVVWRMLIGRRQRGYLAHTEYWIYGSASRVPKTELIMTRMIRDNPHGSGGAPITVREGMLFSDIRLHIALVLKSKNAHVFRPDLFDGVNEVTPEILKRLAEAESFVKVRYLSHARLPDHRQLQFMPHLAESICELMSGTVIFDVTQEKLYLSEEFSAEIAATPQTERPEFHIRVLWREEALVGSWAETRGLRKIGYPELRTDAVDNDQQVLVTGLLDKLARRIFREGLPTETIQLKSYGDTFHVTLKGIVEGTCRVQIGREVRASSP